MNNEMNKPVAWMLIDEINGDYMLERHPSGDYDWIPLYTHPVKELHLSLQKSQEGKLLAVTYTDDEHRIVEVLWEKPPVKELTKAEGFVLTDEEYKNLMKQWDYWRKQIADGDTSSAPRDWFESVIDLLKQY